MGVATFFDAFDALTIAYVVPVLIPLWHLDAGAIGKLFAVGLYRSVAWRHLFWLVRRKVRPGARREVLHRPSCP